MTAAQPPRAATGPLPLLCALGRHKTDLLVRWNDGYYFTRCRRCGLDLVRTAFSGWTVPKGYRVVWQPEAPVADGEVQLVTEDAAHAPVAADNAEPVAPAEAPAAVEFPVGGAPPPPESGRSMVEEAFAARPTDAPQADALESGPRVPLQGRKDDRGGLPIEDVLQSLRGDEPGGQRGPDKVRGSDRGGEAPAPRRGNPATAAASSSSRSRYPVIPDFMDEDFPGITWDPSTGRMIPEAEAAADEARREPKPGWRDAVRGRAQAATAVGMEFVRPRRSGGEPGAAAAADPAPASAPQARRTLLERQGGVIAATIFGGFVLAAAIVDSRSGEPRRIAYLPELRAGGVEGMPGASARASRPRPAASAARPAGGDQAYVTASLLNCRAVPTNDGETVRRLSRGDSVKVLGADPGWVSVSHQGRQCWASSQWISTVKPL